MSIYFVDGNEHDLWNPSSIVARAFVSQAFFVAKELGVTSGLGEIVSDEVVVDPEALYRFGEEFAEFLSSFAEDSKTAVLLGGCFAIVLGLNEMLSQPVAFDSPQLLRYAELGRNLVGNPPLKP